METKTKNREWVKNAAIVFLAVLLVLTFFSNTWMNRSLPEVATQAVTDGSITAKVRGTGTVVAVGNHQVKAPETREIRAVMVKVGQEVSPGDLLFVLGQGEASELEQAQEKLRSLEIQYQRAAAGGSVYSGTGSDDVRIQSALEEMERSYNKMIAIEEKAHEDLPIAQRDAAKEKVAEKEAALAEAKENLSQKESKLAADQSLLDYYQNTYDGMYNSALYDLSQNQANMSAIEEQYTNAKKDYENEKTEYDREKTAFENAESAYYRAVREYEDAKAAWEADPTPEKEAAMNRAKDSMDSAESIYISKKDSYETEKEKYDLIKASYDTADAAYTANQTAISNDTSYMNNLENTAIYGDLKNQKQIVENDQIAVDTAQEEVDQCQTELKKAENELEGWEKAIEEIMAASLDGDEYAKARQEYLSDKTYYISLIEERDLKQAQRAQSAAVTGIELEDLAQQIEITKAKIESLSGGVDNEILANVSGTVQSIECTAGDTKKKGDILCTVEVPDMGHTLSFSVTNDQARRLRVGDKGSVSNYYWGNQITCTLTTIQTDPKNPQNNKLLTFDLEGDVNTGAELTVSVGQKSASYDTIVPNSAIRSDSNGSFVLAVESRSSPLGNRYVARRVNVEVIAADDNNSAVTADLHYGDYVITTSSAPIKSGELVRLADA